MAKQRYPSDLGDREWPILEPLLPAVRKPGPRCGRRRIHSYREIMNGIFYILRSGGSWRLKFVLAHARKPTDLPPWQTVYVCLAMIRLMLRRLAC